MRRAGWMLTALWVSGWGALGAQEGRSAGPSAWDRAWSSFAEWYRNDDHPVVQSVLFTGRYQHDYARVDADEGDHDEWNVRRLRAGFRVGMLRELLVHGEIELNPQERDPLYVRLTDLYLQWSRSEELAVTVGKHGVPFTMDGSTSSKELLTLDRSNLSGNLWFTYEYIPGVSVSGTVSPWVYRVGAFSGGRRGREFGGFDGSVFFTATAGRDFGEGLGVDEALLTANYVYQPPDRDNTFTRPLRHVGSVHLSVGTPRWGVRGDVAAAAGAFEQSDLWGAMATPYLNATERLQLVGRLTLVESHGVNGVGLATYENRVVGSDGDRYRELYLGANWYVYGHKLKLQSGVQFADMEDRAGDGGAFSGVSWTTGFRTSW